MKKLLLAVVAASAVVGAQTPRTFTLDQVLSYPFPDSLVASPVGTSVAWTFNERGVRNIYAADGPTFEARRVTGYTNDDGQELTGLTFSSDGRTIVYVRGGDHGANWPAEGNLMPDPSSSPVQPKLQVWAVAAAGGPPNLLGEGDEPAIASGSGRVAFVKDRRIWIAPLDGSKPAELAVFARGECESPVWSPDGRTLAFVSNRDDHSFIALFTDERQPLRYLAPTTSRDSDPVWSADGRTIAYVRRPGRGGVPKSPLVQQPSPWAIWVADVASGSAHEAWKSGAALVDSIPQTAGGANLHWGAGDRLVFLSYQDGWPHLYSVASSGGAKATLLTPGTFMVEYASMTADRRSVVYNANTGADGHDIDRRHIFKVGVDGAAPPAALTSGAGIEWAPVATSDGGTVAFLGSTAQRSPLPAVVPMAGGQARTVAADRLPASLPSAQLVTPEPVTFRASDGVEVHGQLFKTAAGGAKRPALVYVHGGPPRQMLLGWHYMNYYANDYAVNQYLASRGFIVLAVNYRLGIGYGHAFQYPEHAGARGASEYLDVVAGGKFLQARTDVDARRMGIWGGSYGGYLTALALGRNSDMFAAGVDIHGVHNWDRQGRQTPNVVAAWAGDGITEADLKEAAKVTYQSSPISAVATWRSPVLLIHADDDRNVEFHQTVDLKQRLLEKGVKVDELVIPDDIHDFLLWRTWKTVTTAGGEYLERMLLKGAATSQR
ncbi:MAG TPA: prolyl oligopeptidase family serine peptidase [Vicinamibacterales bacterium]|nr:prolyl oligopeptidase family serine peptidase [Vicinamibacterales bacterium]